MTATSRVHPAQRKKEAWDATGVSSSWKVV